MFMGELEGWEGNHALQVYVAPMGRNEKYCGWWFTEEWQELERTGRTHVLFASGTLRRDDAGAWCGDIVHLMPRSKVRAWRAVAHKGSAVMSFEAL